MTDEVDDDTLRANAEADPLQQALVDAAWLNDVHRTRLRVAVVMSSYDTAFDDVTVQVQRKIRQFRTALPDDGSIELHLFIINDAPAGSHFGRAAAAALDAEVPHWVQAGRARVQPLFSGSPDSPWGLKGLALREGMLAALDAGVDVVAYTNLNLKVHGAHLAIGLRALCESGADAAFGSRALDDGGCQIGAGRLGQVKSKLYSTLFRAMFPSFRSVHDPNGPLKIFWARAARDVVRHARIDGVTLDAEWWLIMQACNRTVSRFPLVWVQRRGSRPPWNTIIPMVIDLVRLRRAVRRGTFSTVT